MNRLTGKTIIITGASKGIGRAAAILLSAHKMNLVLVARSKSELMETAEQVKANGSECSIFSGSVADEQFVEQVVSASVSLYGRIDVMINNAGFGKFGHADEISNEDWDAVFATNTKGTFLFCKAVIPFMKKAGKGQIINIASDVAKRVFAGGSLYCASKYAQDAFSMAIRKELRPFGIKVSVVYSGLVDSSFHAEPQGSDSHRNWLNNEDMANAILFIASQPDHAVIDELMIHPLSQEY